MRSFSAFFLILFIGVLFTSSCKSAKKSFKQGNYEDSVFQSLERLKKSPNNKRAQEALMNAYPSLVNVYDSRIASIKSTSDPMRWEEMYSMYSTLQDIYEETQRTPGASGVISPSNYSSDLSMSKSQIISNRFRLGKDELAQSNRENAKVAYEHFRRVFELDPQRNDAENLMYEAQDKATLYIEFKPIPMHSRVFKLSNQFFESQVIEFMRSETGNPFVQFITSQEVRSSDKKPEHILDIAFDDFIVGQGYEKETVINRTKDSVKVGTATIGDSTVNTYATVKAEVHEFVRTIRSSGLLNANIIHGASGSILNQRKFPGTFEYTDRWGFYNGDERALIQEDKQLIRRKSRLPDPPPQDLFIEFTKPIFDQLTRYLTDFYADF